MLKIDKETDNKNTEFENLQRYQLYKIRDKDIRNIPKTIKCENPICSLDFHPDSDLLTYGSTDGTHKSTVNKCQFTDEGDGILSVSSDKSIKFYDLKLKKIKYQIPNAHLNEIETCLQCEKNLFSTGDRKGVVKCWDLRTKKKKFIDFSEHDDSISKFDYNEDRKVLYCVSLDGRLSVYDLKKGKLLYMSGYAYSSASYLDVVEVNSGGTIICATDSGCLDMYFYGRFDRPANRLKKHQNKKVNPSFESLLFLKEELIAAAHTNGYIGLYNVSRSDKIQHVGGLGKFNSIRINDIALSSDGKFIASSDDELKIRFWHSSFIFDGKNWWEDFEFFEDEKKNRKRKREESIYDIEIVKQVKKKTKFNSKPKRFFADL